MAIAPAGAAPAGAARRHRDIRSVRRDGRGVAVSLLYVSPCLPSIRFCLVVVTVPLGRHDSPRWIASMVARLTVAARRRAGRRRAPCVSGRYERSMACVCVYSYRPKQSHESHSIVNTQSLHGRASTKHTAAIGPTHCHVPTPCVVGSSRRHATRHGPRRPCPYRVILALC